MAEQKDTGTKTPVDRPQAAKTARGPFKSVWNVFSSLKLTVVLLIILALVSIIGTIVAQDDPMKNMDMLVNMFGQAKAPEVLKLMVAMGLTNMYHSWWFVFLLMMLSLNIAVCTIERLPRVIHMVMKKQEPLTDATIRNMALRKEMKIKGDMDTVAGKAAAAMKAMGYSPNEYRAEGEIQYFAEKGKFSRLGVYIAHISVLIIFAGALIGSFWGYKGYAQITEGHTIDSIGLTGKPLLLHVGPEMPLPFQVRCDKFQLKLYQGTDMPSAYLSTLTVIDNGNNVLTKTIRVNDPLEYKGIRFFQSSYGIAPQEASMTIRAIAKGPVFSVHDYTLKRGEKTTLEGSNITMTVSDFSPDVVIGPNNQLMGRSDKYRGSAAAILDFSAGGKPVEQAIILNQDPSSQPKNVPFTFSITGYNGPYYTGLQVTHDPGVDIVWLGCTMLVLGILIAFFLFHKRVWVRVVRSSEKGQLVLTAAGSINKNRSVFEGEFKRFLEKLETRHEKS